MRGERTAKAMKIKIIDSHIKGYIPYFLYQTTFVGTDEPPHRIPRRVHITQLSYISLN